MILRSMNWKILGGAGALVLVLSGLVWAQQQRLSLAKLERDAAVSMYERTSEQYQQQREAAKRLEVSLNLRTIELERAARERRKLQSDLAQLSQEAQDENWQACRNVRTPDTLVERLLSSGGD